MDWYNEEKREFIRIAIPCEISLHSIENHKLISKTENISTGGIRVLITEKLQPSSIITLNIYGVKKEPLICEGRVMWVFSRKNPSNKEETIFDTGIEFYRANKNFFFEMKNFVESAANSKKHIL